MQALEVEQLTAGYEPGMPVVRGASLRAEPGEILVVLGPNGAGKSTLIKAIAGLVPVASGSIHIGTDDITGLPPHHLVRHGIAFVPQTGNVFPRMTVHDNLRLAADALARGESARRIEAMFTRFPDLARQRRLLAGRLSGGQRQMLRSRGPS